MLVGGTVVAVGWEVEAPTSGEAEAEGGRESGICVEGEEGGTGPVEECLSGWGRGASRRDLNRDELGPVVTSGSAGAAAREEIDTAGKEMSGLTGRELGMGDEEVIGKPDPSLGEAVGSTDAVGGGACSSEG